MYMLCVNNISESTLMKDVIPSGSHTLVETRVEPRHTHTIVINPARQVHV